MYAFSIYFNLNSITTLLCETKIRVLPKLQWNAVRTFH